MHVEMAAEEALKKLEEQLSCSICLDTYTDPKLLQCFHIYCRKCLIKLVVRDQQDQLALACPICRQATPVPANGVAGLQSAFHINHLLEIQDSFKKISDQSSTQERAIGNPSSTQEGAVSNHNPIKKASYCSVHGDKEVELYCETCGELVCLKCVIKGGKHHSHDYMLLCEAFKKYREEIRPLLEPMEKQMAAISKALTGLDTRCGHISDQRVAIEVAIEADIDKTIRRFHELLDVRKTELIKQLHQITQRKLKDLAVQRDQIETTQAQLCSCLSFIRQSLKTDHQGEALKMKMPVVKQVKELTTFQTNLLEPRTDVDVAFSASTDITAFCQNYGQILALESPDPSECHITGSNVKATAVGQKSSIVLQAINFKGEPCKKPVESLQCELVSELTGTRARGSIERREQNQYEISYQHAIKGKHQFHIRVEGEHIKGSPFSVAAELPVEKLGIPILITGRMEGPCGMTLCQMGEVLVSETEGHCVSMFSSDGKELRSFGTNGTGQGQFEYPHGVTVDGEGNFIIVDGHNHRIQKFTADGQFITAVGSEGDGSLQFSYPTGIAYNTSNNKIYVVDENYRVQVINSDLTFSSIFGKRGSGKGEFILPRGIACDITGKVYVADTYNHRIQVFSAKGKFLRMFGRHGQGRGELKYPVSIAVDTSGRVYVSEFQNCRISVFTSEGEFVTSFGRRGKGPGEFEGPRGLSVDKIGVVYVCDCGNNRIQVF